MAEDEETRKARLANEARNYQQFINEARQRAIEDRLFAPPDWSRAKRPRNCLERRDQRQARRGGLSWRSRAL